MVTVYQFIVLILATFRLTKLIVSDDISLPFRKLFHIYVDEKMDDGTTIRYLEVKGSGLKRFVGELISCYWCTGIWCAAFLYGGLLLFPEIFMPFIFILAIAGSASILYAFVERQT